MEDMRATPASGATQTKGRSAARTEPSSPHRHHLRAEEWPTLGDATPGDGLRQWSNLLAQAARLAEGWRVAQAAPGATQSPGRSRQDRLVESFTRLGHRSSQRCRCRCKKGDLKAAVPIPA